MKKLKHTNCAAKIRIIGEDNRLRIIRELMRGPKNVGELEKKLTIEQSLLSHHLKALRDEDIVRTTRSGRFITYELIGRKSALVLDLGCCEVKFKG